MAKFVEMRYNKGIYQERSLPMYPLIRRYLRRVVRPGDSVTAGGATGVVRELHPLSVEVELPGGERVHLPNAQLIEDQIRVNRS